MRKISAEVIPVSWVCTKARAGIGTRATQLCPGPSTSSLLRPRSLGCRQTLHVTVLYKDFGEAAGRGLIGLSQSCSGGPGSLWIWNSQGRASLFSEEECLESLGPLSAHPSLPPARPPARWLQSLETTCLKGAEGWVSMSQGNKYSSFRYPKSSWWVSSISPFNTQLLFLISLTVLGADFLSLLACLLYLFHFSLFTGWEVIPSISIFFSVCLDTLTCILNLPKYKFNHILIPFFIRQ